MRLYEYTKNYPQAINCYLDILATSNQVEFNIRCKLARLYRRLKKNQTVDKKYQLLSVHNSFIGRNFFFNPLKKNLNNDLYSYTSSKDKIDINSYLKNIKNNNTSVHEIKTTKNATIMKYIDRKDNSIINLDRFNNKTDRAKIDSIKKNLINYGNTKEVKIKDKIKSITNINKNNLNYLINNIDNNKKIEINNINNNIIKNVIEKNDIDNKLNNNKEEDNEENKEENDNNEKENKEINKKDEKEEDELYSEENNYKNDSNEKFEE